MKSKVKRTTLFFVSAILGVCGGCARHYYEMTYHHSGEEWEFEILDSSTRCGYYMDNGRVTLALLFSELTSGLIIEFYETVMCDVVINGNIKLSELTDKEHIVYNGEFTEIRYPFKKGYYTVSFDIIDYAPNMEYLACVDMAFRIFAPPRITVRFKTVDKYQSS